ncbi:hypothetical protein HMPREF9318_01283 [Streptococcus urinalis FB127-CNA-2]|uniref:Uncharacterized protein n=1 Tax=Streptococcus urinalis 2285-97 TaxID=764291 RepID=G5KCD2_9STRE|nr:hypothetical protein [Streptococcus urinalis]EHJ57584.1 hypothetical protein STRUR_0447 [Streptococcus urinalis 2285-97]EKS19761.1 hypothetical protein HMPREF9318_01283 [Streptococcus urinalis FB127-CNA-2]VEF31338.1 signal peptide containing protein [Streptococcus urinalis]
MKQKKNETIYLMLSIILIAVGGMVYLLYGTESSSTSVTTSSSNAVTKNQSTKEAEKLIKELEANPSKELLEKAQAALDKVDNPKKDSLQKRITAISEFIKAQELVSAVETNPTQGNLDTAKEAVNQLADGDRKTKLQKRLDAIVIPSTNASVDQSEDISVPESSAVEDNNTADNSQATAGNSQSTPTIQNQQPTTPSVTIPNTSTPQTPTPSESQTTPSASSNEQPNPNTDS